MKNWSLKKPSRGKHYAYFNANPMKKETGDCVIRAMAVAFDKTWFEIYDELSILARKLATVIDDDDCWKEYLANHNMQEIHTIRNRKHVWKDGNEFALAHKEGRYILEIANHLSVLVDGVIYDIWDCSSKFVYKAWQITE